LLLLLISIDGYPQLTLVYFDDFPVDAVRRLRKSESESDTAYFLGPEEIIAEVNKFFGARWHPRMWCSLEFAYCKQACILTEE
jgi:hypothetical protein